MKFTIAEDVVVKDVLAIHIASEFLEWLETKSYAIAYAGDIDPYDSYVDMAAAWVEEYNNRNS